MSSRIFQGVIVQMKDATTRCIGVVDEQGFVIACSELSMIGSRLDDFQAAVGEVQEQLFSTDARTYKILSASTARFEYAVFVEGNDQTARSICILAAVGMTEASTNFEEKHNKAAFVKNIISDNILPGDVYVRAKELHFTTDVSRAVLLVRQTVFRGGQPDAPAAVPTAPAVTALPAPTHVTVQPLAATRDALADTQRADASAHTTPETAAVPAAAAGEILPRYRALYEKNPDLIGWLRIDGTDIDLPVVQTPGDNEYYLRRGFDRFYAVGGTLFLDERCSVSADAPTANWLIYGHNMHDGSMFGQLVRYRDEDFYKAHPTFTFDTLYEGGTWQVVAAVDTALGADTLPYYTFFDADTKLDWQHRVRAITEKALYDTGVMPEYGAQLLTLSTCGDTHPDTDARFALLAVRID